MTEQYFECYDKNYSVIQQELFVHLAARSRIDWILILVVICEYKSPVRERLFMSVYDPILLILTKESAIVAGGNEEVQSFLEAMVYLALEFLRLIYQSPPEEITVAMV